MNERSTTMQKTKYTLTLLLLFSAVLLAGNTKENHVQRLKDHIKSVKQTFFSDGTTRKNEIEIPDTYKDRVYQSWQNGEWTNVYREVSQIDTTSSTWVWTNKEYQWQNGSWKIDFEYELKTSSLTQGQPIFLEAKGYAFMDSQWVTVVKVSYYYDREFLNEVLTEIAVAPDSFRYYDRVLYTYNAEGLPETEIFQTYEEDWVNSTKKSLSYDVAGNLIQVYIRQWEETEWVEQTRMDYEYFETNLINSESIFQYSEGTYFPWNKTVYQYNDSWQLTLEDLYTGSGTNWVHTAVTLYSYNSNNLLDNSIYSYVIEGGVQPVSRRKFTYENFLETEVREQSYLGGEWVDKHRELIYYTVTSNNDLEPGTKVFTLENNYPNPFNPSTTIRFTLMESAEVSLKVYNVLGAEVAVVLNQYMPAGVHSVTFNAGELTSGVYFYTLTTGKFSVTKKMNLIK